MSDWIDGSKTGDLAFVDSDGFQRYRGRTCNLYGTAYDAADAARKALKSSSPFYIWRTVDGLFDFTARREVEEVPVTDQLPELAGAEMVGSW